MYYVLPMGQVRILQTEAKFNVTERKTKAPTKKDGMLVELAIFTHFLIK